MTRSTERILATFGVTTATLDETQRTQLDQDGYLPLPGILSPEQVEALRRRFGELVAAEGDQAGLEAHQEGGTDRLGNLVDKDPLFDLVWNNPVQLAAVAHVLDWNEFKLFSLNGRSALPGEGHQALHQDYGRAVQPGEYQICNSIWLLD